MLQAVGQRDAPVFELKGEQTVVYKGIGVGDDIQAGVQAAVSYTHLDVYKRQLYYR